MQICGLVLKANSGQLTKAIGSKHCFEKCDLESPLQRPFREKGLEKHSIDEGYGHFVHTGPSFWEVCVVIVTCPCVPLLPTPELQQAPDGPQHQLKVQDQVFILDSRAPWGLPEGGR